ncbi:hypothetical protein [Streptomyces sp. NPDC048659]|uniref:hypothetical protein n=1 Tax=Streptomyces sp. NPDC048659 TaxID=3155489 RepID=UPI00341FEA0D
MSIGFRDAAALSAAVWFGFLHAAVPSQSLHIHDRADVETTVLLLAVGLIVSHLAARACLVGAAAFTDAVHLQRLPTRRLGSPVPAAPPRSSYGMWGRSSRLCWS